MANPTLYKKKPIVDVRNRQTEALTSAEKLKVTETVNKFFTLFKAEHL